MACLIAMGIFKRRARQPDWGAVFIGDQLLAHSEAFLVFQAPNMSEPLGSRTVLMVGLQKIAFYLADLPDAPVNVINIPRSEISAIDHDQLSGEVQVTTSKGGWYRVAGIESLDAVVSALKQ